MQNASSGPGKVAVRDVVYKKLNQQPHVDTLNGRKLTEQRI